MLADDFTDVKGYYQALGIKPGANAAAIKRAYRARVKDAHPDTGGDEDGAAFREISDAYDILCDTVKRREYDAVCSTVGATQRQASENRQSKPTPTGDRPRPTRDARKPANENVEAEPEAARGAPDMPEPVQCDRCETVSAQPRHVRFQRLMGPQKPISESFVEGVYCKSCADKVALEASALTWLLGWWRIPRGPVETVRGLVGNLVGGRMDPDVNAAILTRQSLAFAARGNPALASGLAMQAYAFRPDDGLKALIGLGDGRRLKDRWRAGGMAFILQTLPFALVAAWLLIWAGSTVLALLRA